MNGAPIYPVLGSPEGTRPRAHPAHCGDLGVCAKLHCGVSHPTRTPVSEQRGGRTLSIPIAWDTRDASPPRGTSRVALQVPKVLRLWGRG